MTTQAASTVRAGVLAAASSVLVAGALTVGSPACAQGVLPAASPPFKGQIALGAKDSVPDFPQPVQAPSGAPNVLLVLLDDVGYSASATFGGAVDMPTLDRLAASGLRYTQFHTTAVCSPTRAALITGRNHHSVHTGVITEMATGYPGYDSLMGKDTATVAEVLKQHGWNTAWFGKNHNVPDWQTSQAGPFDLWPTGLGFEHFYGFIGAETNQWRPAVFDGTRPVEPYLGKPDYNFDYDMADQAIQWLQNQKAVTPDRPFFIYYAPGATHSPHHPKREWVEKYAGRFDMGWDRLREETLARQKKLGLVPPDTQLTKRHPEIPAWDSLNAEQKRLAAYMMEVYAGYLSQTDYNVGRVIDAIAQLGQLDETLILYIVGDNGASQEGGMQGALNELAGINGYAENYQQILARKDDIGTWKTHNHYPIGWAHATNAPFKYAKAYASHYGGTANGMVASWPARIKDRGGIRPQWHHVIDVVPTIYDAAGVEQPSIVNGVTQKPIEGTSMVYSFDDAKAPSTRHTQYFEIFGQRAIYHDGWVACTTPLSPLGQIADPTVDIVSGYRWELYDVAHDFSEAVDLAAKNPDKLTQMQLLFYAEAAKYDVLPLDHSRTPRMDVSIRPSLTRGRTEFAYRGTVARVPEGAAPNVKNKSFSITADVVLPKGDESGVLVTQGGMSGGYALLLRQGRPVFHYNYVNIAHFEVGGTHALAPGKHRIVLDFRYDGGGIGRGGTGALIVDGEQVAQSRIDRTIPIRMSFDETFDVGEDTGTPVSSDYDVPFAFSGTLEQLVVRLGDSKLPVADEQQLQRLEPAAWRAVE